MAYLLVLTFKRWGAFQNGLSPFSEKKNSNNRQWDFSSNFACYLSYRRNIKTECPRSRLEAAVPFLIHDNSLQFQYNFSFIEVHALNKFLAPFPALRVVLYLFLGRFSCRRPCNSSLQNGLIVLIFTQRYTNEKVLL